MAFLLTANVKITAQWASEPIRRAVARLYRDVAATLLPDESAPTGTILVCVNPSLPPEQYTIDAPEGSQLVVCASDDLGAVYALLKISERWLGVSPLWFWNDQHFIRQPYVEITTPHEASTPAAVKFRGWFLNDEVLLTHWNAGVSQEYVWEMAFEALLRCGGNLVIPGTGRDAAPHLPLAAAMGLWLTHHHAEPLGAELFASAYPALTPSYTRYPEQFQALWAAAIERQKKQKIIWGIGFRGQGDCPFWESDPACDTPEKRGALMSRVLREQYRMVRGAVPDAPVCTNLYGEVLALYTAGLLTLPRDVIRIWGDNGYGKMVSRRQGNHDPRLPALPPAAEPAPEYAHGTYYHLSFYDLQAANHLTMAPNSMEFICRELSDAYRAGIRTLWVLNVSNIKPHVYPIHVTAALWQNPAAPLPAVRDGYLRQYYRTAAGEPQSPGALAGLAVCMESWADATAAFGPLPDQHAGEQFSNYTTRILAQSWLLCRDTETAPALGWATGPVPFAAQIAWYRARCAESLSKMERLWERCESVAETGGPLWEDSLLLQTRVYTLCLHGAVLFCDAWVHYTGGDYPESFYLLGAAADDYADANKALREREHDRWAGFYANDCLTDIKLTARLLRGLMGAVRARGDGPHYFSWQRRELCSAEEQGVMLLTNTENHLSDEQLYLLMARRRAADHHTP